jgi:AMP nucleosidase
VEISIDRLEHYTGSRASEFQRWVLLTNYDMYMEKFLEKFPDAKRPTHPVQMPAYHHKYKNGGGITIVNVGVGPANVKTFIDHLAVLRTDAIIMLGHAGGLRNHQKIGDFVIASGYIRDDHVMDNIIPLTVPITSHHILNYYSERELLKNRLNYRFGNVFTTGDRNWEFRQKDYLSRFMVSRPIAIDMESATVATCGFKYRIPSSTLLCISDKPLHGKPKLSAGAKTFYKRSKDLHFEIGVKILRRAMLKYPHGFPSSSQRNMREALLNKI